ncbi:hypothetical protein N6H13_00815 [Paenibacillus sp. CC-CFT742]|nr:hypothetical protein [Paenibacillus sp. CC-CFT742]WJH29378.1 hypothetical protein N6H13_00815 [Paenibacillus sp. CC-CFT742]
MLTTDRAVEALVEKFAEMCSKDYSLKTDRSQEIIDYVLGNTDKFPEMIGNSSHYVYYTIDALMKLAKKDDGDIFFRAGAIVIHLESHYSRRNSWATDGFTICLGNDSEAYGLSGKSKSPDRIGGLLSRLEKIRQFAGEKEIVDELKSRLSRVQVFVESKKGNGYGNHEREIIDALLLLKLYSKLNGVPSQTAQLQLLSNQLPELLQLVVADNAEQLRPALHKLVEPLVVCSMQSRSNRSVHDLKPEFLQQKRNRLMEELYPDTSLNKKEQLSQNVFHQTMILISSSLLYLINVHGERTVSSKTKTKRVKLYWRQLLSCMKSIRLRRACI